MASKRLLFVVDSAAELKPHWQASLRDLLAVIVRYLHRAGSTSQDLQSPKPAFGLIVFGSQGPCTEAQVLPWGWTNDENTFLAWLSAVPFTSGDFSETAVADGLTTALKTIAAVKDSNEAPAFGQNHCILVTSYKSLPLLPVQDDQILDNEKNYLQNFDWFFADATAAARNFVPAFVSLSIISPNHSLRLREIFTVGNVYNPRAVYCSDNQQNFNYLVLLSDNFMEAHAAVNYWDFVVKPADYKGKAIEFETYLVPSSMEECPDEGMQMVGDNFTEVLPSNEPQTSLADSLNEIEAWLLGSDRDDDGKKQQENDGESSTNQHDAIGNNMPTVDDMMASLENVVNWPVVSPIQDQETDERVHGGNVTAFGLVPRDQSLQ